MKEWILILSLILIMPIANAVYIDGNNTIGNETLVYNESENVTLNCRWINGELVCGVPSFVSYVETGGGIVEAPEPDVNLTFTKSDIERFYTAENATGDAIQDIRASLRSYYDFMKRNRETFESYMDQTDKQLELFNKTVHTVIYVTNESTAKALRESEGAEGRGMLKGIGTIIGVISTIGGSAIVYWVKWGRWGW